MYTPQLTAITTDATLRISSRRRSPRTWRTQAHRRRSPSRPRRNRTLLFLLGLLGLRRRWAWVRQVLGDRRRLLILSVASVVIAVNWGVYIWAVNHGHVVEAALGYYINPLVTVLLGVALLRERLRAGQWVAVGLATLAVVVLTVDLGRPPWIALLLAFSFAT